MKLKEVNHGLELNKNTICSLNKEPLTDGLWVGLKVVSLILREDITAQSEITITSEEP